MSNEHAEPKLKIAIVDDSRFAHKVVSSILEEVYDLTQYLSATEALKDFETNIPDLILLDVEMPKMNGLEAIKLLKENPKTENIPVIFLTGRVDLEFEFLAFDLGAVDYIKKPFITPLLLKRVAMHINHAQQKIELIGYNSKLHEMVKEKTETIVELQQAIVFTLANVVEMRDTLTGGHINRTQAYFKVIVDYLNENKFYQKELKGKDPRMLAECSQLHDVGKVAIPDSVLLKPGRLNSEEFEIMKTHSNIGYDIISNAMNLTKDKEFLKYAAEIALTHHEKWDGEGYPNKLRGEDIPLLGRIMAIVDVYDALISKRHYKDSMSHNEAMEIIQEGRGTHFDPILVDAVTSIGFVFKSISKKYATE